MTGSAARLQLVNDAIDQLAAAIEHALDVCDTLDDGFRTDGGTRAGTNLPELLSAALTQVARRSDPGRLTMHRPGSWEATHIEALDLSHLWEPADG